MKKSKKQFDAVQMMREIRDRLSEQFRKMSFEEQRQYIRKHTTAKLTKSRKEQSGAHTP